MECSTLMKMINRMNAAHYLECNPYSQIGNSRMGKDIAEGEICFFKNFLVQSSSTFDRLNTIAKALSDPSKNTVFITGYRGSGKTTFSKYLQAIIEGRYPLPDFKECKKFDMEFNPSLSPEQAKSISSTYDKVEDDINQLAIKMGLGGTITNPSHFLCSHLHGKCLYMNFEVGISQTPKPVEEKLNKEVSFLLHNSCNNDKGFAKKLCKIYFSSYDKFHEFFEGVKEHTLKDFFTCLNRIETKKELYSDISNELAVCLSNFSLGQLLCLYTIINFLLTDAIDQNVYFIFDNIDVIFDVNTLEDFVKEYVIFSENFANLLPAICANDELRNRESFYDNLLYIFVMRETSAMQISDHFTDRLYDVSIHFDISTDVLKREIIRKKFSYLQKKRGQISNPKLYETVDCINSICQDYYICNIFFSLFNNDYKRSMNCLTEICNKNLAVIQEELQLISDPASFNKHGARGIMFRLLFDFFREKGYFGKLQLDGASNQYRDFSVCRVLLTYLNNLQPEHNDQFIVDYNDIISLKELFDAFIHVLSTTPNQAKHLLVDALWSMYELRKSEAWNHLITFDSINTVEKGTVLAQVEKYQNHEEFSPDIRLRITCAGRTFVNFVCTHFEYFATRFSNEYKPLFCEENMETNEKGEYMFEGLIQNVFSSVSKCCERLDQFTSSVFFERLNYTKDTLLKSKYSHKREERIPILHQERIVHQHIGYIEAYREHLIRYRGMNPVCINMKIIRFIQNYIKLLENNELYGSVSGALVDDLNTCIDYIVKRKEYDDTTTDISRDGAKRIQTYK